jgi:preprotein translocase subunit SecG
METVILVVHLMIALAIIVLVLLQRSSGGGLGIGGGGGGMGDFATARSTASVLTKATSICAVLFFCTSLSLGILAKNKNVSDGERLFSETSMEETQDSMENAFDDLENAINDAASEAESTIPDIPTPTE